MVDWPDGSHSSVKDTLGVFQRALKDSQTMRNKILWSEYQVSRLEENWHHPYGEVWWWQHHAVGMFFSSRDCETSKDRGKDDRSKVQRDP